MSPGDTAWVLASAAMVLLMTPGLAFFYGGLVRERNAVNTIKMCFIALGVIALEWAVIGYSHAFDTGSTLIGGHAYLGLAGVGPEPSGTHADNIPHLAFMAFQMMFAIITPALISGAVVGRMRFKAYAAFILLWALLVYNPLAHWVWGPGGWIGEMGALDFAGGTVVHVSAGVSALVAAAILGPRRSRSAASESEERPHNVPMVVLGTGLLWFGWMGFNAGSSLAADGIAALAVVTTMLSAAAAVAAWIGVDLVRGKKPTVINASIAAVVGLVGITPAAGFVTPGAAVAIGGITALVSYVGMALIKRSRFDDALDVFACHGLGGVTGALLTGVFATTAVNAAGADGLLAGNAALLVHQAAGVLAAAALAAVGTAAILWMLARIMRLRASADEELLGVDVTEHDEIAYAITGPVAIRRPHRRAEYVR